MSFALGLSTSMAAAALNWALGHLLYDIVIVFLDLSMGVSLKSSRKTIELLQYDNQVVKDDTSFRKIFHKSQPESRI